MLWCWIKMQADYGVETGRLARSCTIPGTKKCWSRGCRPHQHYRKRSNLQLMSKYYNDRVTQDKATGVVLACRGGRDGF
jgi:hypothetical protein